QQVPSGSRPSTRLCGRHKSPRGPLGMSRMPRVAVGGGSIGGLTAALVLRDAGSEVEVFERSGTLLSSFGAGIVVQPELVRYFLERTSITLDEISVPSSSVRYFDAGSGTLLGEVPGEWRYTS